MPRAQAHKEYPRAWPSCCRSYCTCSTATDCPVASSSRRSRQLAVGSLESRATSRTPARAPPRCATWPICTQAEPHDHPCALRTAPAPCLPADDVRSAGAGQPVPASPPQRPPALQERPVPARLPGWPCPSRPPAGAPPAAQPALAHPPGSPDKGLHAARSSVPNPGLTAAVSGAHARPWLTACQHGCRREGCRRRSMRCADILKQTYLPGPCQSAVLDAAPVRTWMTCLSTNWPSTAHSSSFLGRSRTCAPCLSQGCLFQGVAPCSF